MHICSNLTNTNAYMVKSNLPPFTKREFEIMQLLLKGKLNKEIASDCGISIDTVKKHIKNSYRKMGVRNRTEAVLHLTNRAA